MPQNSNKKRTSQRKAKSPYSLTTQSRQSRNISPNTKRSCVTNSSPTRKPPRKFRPRKEVMSAGADLMTRNRHNCQNNSLLPLPGKGRHNKPDTLEDRLNKIISMLGLIPGERAMDLAAAYDSVTPLLRERRVLGLTPPVSPPDTDRFNLLYIPPVFTPAMKKMKLINRYTHDILLGYRRNAGTGCNLDEMLEMFASEYSQLEPHASEEKKKRKIKTRPRAASKVYPHAKNLIGDVSQNKRIRGDHDRHGPWVSGEGPPTTLAVRRFRKSHSACAPLSRSRRSADVVLKSTCQCPGRLRHQGTNTDSVVVKIRGQSLCCNNSSHRHSVVTIFIKHSTMRMLAALIFALVAAVHAAPVKERMLFFDDLNTLVHDVVNTIGDGIDKAIHDVGQVVTNVGDALGVGTVAGTLTGLVNTVVDKTTDVVGGAVNELVDVVKSGADGATLGLGNTLLSMAKIK
ncbi:hypothetical protein Btru_041709 [Bulinus truncatus]|nr:hypothetical protein Btru_041709 [Bulinus truncatus]